MVDLVLGDFNINPMNPADGCIDLLIIYCCCLLLLFIAYCYLLLLFNVFLYCLLVLFIVYYLSLGSSIMQHLCPVGSDLSIPWQRYHVYHYYNAIVGFNK